MLPAITKSKIRAWTQMVNLYIARMHAAQFFVQLRAVHLRDLARRQRDRQNKMHYGLWNHIVAGSHRAVHRG